MSPLAIPFSQCILFFLIVLINLNLSTMMRIDASNNQYEANLNNPYIDHLENFEKIFNVVKDCSFLEFGLGEGTRYFLDRCRSVTSVEIKLPEQSVTGYYNCLNSFQNYQNWHPILYYGSQKLSIADQIAVNQSNDPALLDASYILEIKDLCDSIFQNNKFDVAFVNPRIHPRGDIVNELFDRVDIIIAHDTAYSFDIYGWNKIQTPQNYEKFDFNNGYGTTFWIKNNRKDVISALKMEEINTSRRSLRIFFPNIHYTLTRSMALTCKYLGHTLLIPGPSFKPGANNLGPKISYQDFAVFKDSEALIGCLDNVEFIENDVFFSNLPDVIFINCYEVEKDVLNIFHLADNVGNVKLAHYSGNPDTVYNASYVRNLVSVDSLTHKRHKNTNVNVVFWIPWIDFASLTFDGINDQKIVNSYLYKHYSYWKFPAQSIYDSFTGNYIQHFPDVKFNNFGYLPLVSVYKNMSDSCATLHIKDFEGFGYTIIESLAKGRPVFLKRSFSVGSRLMNWCIEGQTALFFDSYEEFQYKLNEFLENSEYRHRLQNNSAKIIRSLIDNEKQARILDGFLQNLQ